MNKENLLKLADWVEKNVKQEQFNMTSYRRNGKDTVCAFKSATECGTVGCLVGWAPFVPSLAPIDSEFNWRQGGLNFIEYQVRVFDLDSNQAFGAWDIVFSGAWYEIDNTVEGAVKRIRDLVNGNEEALSRYQSQLIEGDY